MWNALQTLSARQLGIVKAGLFIAALIPLLRLIWLGFTNSLGANPIEFITHSTGTWRRTPIETIFIAARSWPSKKSARRPA